MVDVCWCEVAGGTLQKRRAVAADRIPPELHQQGLNSVGIELLRSDSHNFAQRRAKRDGLTIRALTSHGVESVSQADDSYLHRNIFVEKSIRIAGAVGALVMPAHNLRNAWPRELNAGNDLVPDGCMVSHLAELFRIKRSRLPEQPLINCHLPDVVQISRRAQGS